MKKRGIFLVLTMGLALATALSPSPANYYPHAIGDYDGSSDYLSLGSDLTGNADGKLGLFSCLFRIDGGDGVIQYILANNSAYFALRRLADNTLVMWAHNADTTQQLELISNSTYTADATWHHMVASWDVANAKGFFYVDDVADLAGGPTIADGTIDYTRVSWSIAAYLDGTSSFNGAIAEFYFALEYLDISVEANRRLFISASGNPVFLGGDGSLPTGTAPIIYMRSRANNAGLNSGTGGDFTINGAPLFTEGPVPFIPSMFFPGRARGSRLH